ncbi:hypothetical protein L5220_07025 [Synechococcus sp. PCC 6716]|nr:hypothetical protein [Synechococcus sp. PCC 6716]
MVRGGVYEQFRGALLGGLWGLEQQSPVLVKQYRHQWLADAPAQDDWCAALPHLLAAWQQPLIVVPAPLANIQALLHEYLEQAWRPEPLVKPVNCLAAAPEPVMQVRYALAIAPGNLMLAQHLLKDVPTLPLLGCLFGAYWGALALPPAAWAHWRPELANVVDRSMSRWCGGTFAELAVAPAGRLHPRPPLQIRNN